VSVTLDKEYRTVLNCAAAEYEEKKSKFIATVKPVSGEDEALDFIDELRSRYWDASHNVYAYYICGKTTIQRFSDDGEPSGTAGMPVLEVIKRMDVRDIVVVVTRYYGGINLGASGLIRAYSKSASLGIEAARIITKKLCTRINLTVEYNLFGKVQNMLMSKGVVIADSVFGQDAEISVYVPVNEVENFCRQVIEITNDRILLESKDNAYITLDEKGNLISI